MKIASWNINSIRTRLDQLSDWLSNNHIDIVGLQETKCEDAKFPREHFEALGYQCFISGQKSYNGVAFLSKFPLKFLYDDHSFFQQDQKRFIACEWQDILFVNIYVPNGQSVGSEKYLYKLDWFEQLLDFVKTAHKKYSKMLILGDFNIAPTSLDYPKKSWIKDEIMRSAAEQEYFHQLISLGFIDSFRIFNQKEGQYSWWDYRIRAFEKNLGYRIDHILISDILKKHCENCEIDERPRANERPSDHAPIIVELEF